VENGGAPLAPHDSPTQPWARQPLVHAETRNADASQPPKKACLMARIWC